MSDEVLSIGPWRTNGEMIRDVARLNYLHGSVLDLTYGYGGFWRVWRPVWLVTNDRYVEGCDHAWDYRNLPCADDAFDSVVFDPPYKLNGTPMLGEQDVRYGTDKRTSRDDVMIDMTLGLQESLRVASKFVLVKCQDQVEGGQRRWQTDWMTRVADDCGARKVDRFDIGVAGRPQPKGRRQLTSRSKHSTLLVFAP